MEPTFMRCAALASVAILLQSVGLVLFVLGFFPVKPALSGISGNESLAKDCHNNLQSADDVNSHQQPQSLYRENCQIPAQYDRLVIMVVDGLPAEFVLGKCDRPSSKEMKAMSYTQSLLASGRAYGYHAKAAPPTVTMPRLKAMTSGAIAGFLDVAFNFNTQALLEDNIIGQLALAGWQMVMLGDDTWLRLFPDVFFRHDGVSSFYVKDTVEVDKNVTRHLDHELVTSDWNLLVLHYLGLDHIGHLGGRNSPLMMSKLQEMDKVIERIHHSMVVNTSSASTLLLVVSDHGMTDGGNHGGATAQETDTLALFIPSRSQQSLSESKNADHTHATCIDHTAFQVDLVPTLSLLLGIPIPKNSVGVVLAELFLPLTSAEQLEALELNLWQLLRLLVVQSPRSSCVQDICGTQVSSVGHLHVDKFDRLCMLFRSATELHMVWRQSIKEPERYPEQPEFEVVKEAYLNALKSTSEWLARGTTEKQVSYLVTGCLMMMLSVVLFYSGLLSICKKRAQNKSSGKASGLEMIVAVGGVTMHLGSLGSSSLVEEEQYTWHFLSCTLCVALIWTVCLSIEPGKNKSATQKNNQNQRSVTWTKQLDSIDSSIRKSGQSFEGMGGQGSAYSIPCRQKSRMTQVLLIILVLLLGRILRAWHRSGVNWAHLPDIAKWLDSGDPRISAAGQVTSIFFVTILCGYIMLKPLPWQLLQKFMTVLLILSACFILLYVCRSSNRATITPGIWELSLARVVFGLLSVTSLGALLIFPWTVSLHQYTEGSSPCQCEQVSVQCEHGLHPENDYYRPVEVAVMSAMNSIGNVLVSSWCLVQLMLQNPINAMPVTLLLLQLILILAFFREAGTLCSKWLPVLTLHWLGASGHFNLGNSNTLATVDVAGAYIGLSSHSTVLSGVLAFMITYASPLLYMLGLFLNDQTGGHYVQEIWQLSDTWLLDRLLLPCLLPLALNSVVLVVFTGILVLMQNHLFVWSVFSPKYLYAVANTTCMYVGVAIFGLAGAYSSLVVLKRARALPYYVKLKQKTF